MMKAVTQKSHKYWNLRCGSCSWQTGTGPAFSRLDRLLPIEPRAKGGPALRLQTYSFNRKCLCSAGVGPTIF